MANQIRKYELDAIAEEVVSKLTEKAKQVQSDLEKQSDYKQIQEVIKIINRLQDQEKDIDQRISIRRKELKEFLEIYNQGLNQNLRLDHNSYGAYCDTKDSVSWTLETWHIKDQVNNKLAIALMSPDARNRMSEVIQEVVESLS